jgi:hypothetical protein
MLGDAPDDLGFASTDVIKADIHLRAEITNATWSDESGFIAKKGYRITRKFIKDFSARERLKYGIHYIVDTIAANTFTDTSISDLLLPEDSEIAGIQFINLCRRIRAAIKAGTLIVDELAHKSNNGRNLHLVKLLETCGLTYKQFVIAYLSNMQPCTLNTIPRGKNQGAEDIIALYDRGYKISLYLKFKDRGRIVVSMHEDNIQGKSRVSCENITTSMIAQKYSCLIVEPNMNYREGEIITKRVQMSRGFATFNFMCRGIAKSRDTVIITTADLTEYLYSMIVNYIYQLCAQTGILTTENKELLELYRTKEQTPMISVASYGGYVTSMLSLIADLYPTVSQRVQTTLIAAIDIIVDEELNAIDLIPIRDALKERYMNYTNNALEHFYALIDM